MSTSYASSYEEIKEALAGLIGLGGIALLIVVAIIALVVALVIHYIEAIPTYIIAKKNSYRYAWVALLPFSICTTFVLSAIPGNRNVKITEKLSMKNVTAFVTYILIALIGSSLMGIVSKALLVIPVLGLFLSIVARYLPVIALAIIEYAFLKDVIDIYNHDKKSNIITAVVVVVANKFLVIVRGIYLWTLVGKTPANQPIVAEFTEE